MNVHSVWKLKIRLTRLWGQHPSCRMNQHSFPAQLKQADLIAFVDIFLPAGTSLTNVTWCKASRNNIWKFLLQRQIQHVFLVNVWRSYLRAIDSLRCYRKEETMTQMSQKEKKKQWNVGVIFFYQFMDLYRHNAGNI